MNQIIFTLFIGLVYLYQDIDASTISGKLHRPRDSLKIIAKKWIVVLEDDDDTPISQINSVSIEDNEHVLLGKRERRGKNHERHLAWLSKMIQNPDRQQGGKFSK